MESRKLGRQGLEVAALGLGCMGMTGIYKTGADTAECEATLIEAVEAGVTLFDTAEIYGPYANEELLGRTLGGSRRDRVEDGAVVDDLAVANVHLAGQRVRQIAVVNPELANNF